MEASQAQALLAAAKERKARANARAMSTGLHPSIGQRPETPAGVTVGGGVDIVSCVCNTYNMHL